MKSNHYINNEEFLRAIIEYREKYYFAKENNLGKPKIPEYIGMCFIKIAENLVKKNNFSGYSFKDELLLDAIENCVQVCHNFNPVKSSNPFSYFTQITYYAFVRRIVKEKKQLYIKYKATEHFGMLDETVFEDENGNIKQFELYSNLSEYIEDYEDSLEMKKMKRENRFDAYIEEEEDF